MYKTIFTLFAFCFAPLSFAQSCESNANALVARYTVETHNARGDQQKRLELWRNERVVAHRYPQTQITEAWEQVNTSLIKPTRYFDAHARAIEYQPGEKVHGKSETNWSFRNQLFSDELIATMTETSRTGSGCNTLITFEREDNGTRLTLIWQPQMHDDSWGGWLSTQVNILLAAFLIIAALTLIIRLLRFLHIERLVHHLLAPLLRLLGIGKTAANFMIVGLTLGISFGGGLMINEARSGKLSGQDIFMVMFFLALCHSIIEDTLLISKYWDLNNIINIKNCGLLKRNEIVYLI